MERAGGQRISMVEEQLGHIHQMRKLDAEKVNAVRGHLCGKKRFEGLAEAQLVLPEVLEGRVEIVGHRHLTLRTAESGMPLDRFDGCQAHCHVTLRDDQHVFASDGRLDQVAQAPLGFVKLNFYCHGCHTSPCTG
jgi:hypothetical protein